MTEFELNLSARLLYEKGYNPTSKKLIVSGLVTNMSYDQVNMLIPDLVGDFCSKCLFKFSCTGFQTKVTGSENVKLYATLNQRKGKSLSQWRESMEKSKCKPEVIGEDY